MRRRGPKAQALGVVHVLISSEAAEYRLPQYTDQRVATVLAVERTVDFDYLYVLFTDSVYENPDPNGAFALLIDRDMV